MSRYIRVPQRASVWFIGNVGIGDVEISNRDEAKSCEREHVGKYIGSLGACATVLRYLD